MTVPSAKPFYTYLREERQFSFLLAALLMQRGPALKQLLTLAEGRNETNVRLRPDDGLLDAEIYVEFAPLRDRWALLLSEQASGTTILPAERHRANISKRAFIADLLASSPTLAHLAGQAVQESVAEFNSFFMGPAGTRIAHDIASPALWSVKALADNFGTDPAVFVDLCRLKWSFHIKPDLVVVRPGLPSVCVEAKLESGEGTYPVGEEAKLFDSVAGPGKRVGQFSLQVFLFQVLLKEPFVPVVVQKTHPVNRPSYPVLVWSEVFSTLIANPEIDCLIPFVRRFAEGNRSLLPS